MSVVALKQKPAAVLKTFYATVLVTRAEEWCVEAETAEEARELLSSGAGYSLSARRLRAHRSRGRRGLT
jgi:hypothetical protein